MRGYVVVAKTELYGRRKKFWRKFWLAVALIIVFAVLLAARLYWNSMTPTILELAKVHVQSQSAQAINEAVLELFSNGVSYVNFVMVEKNENNDVVLLVTDSVQINKLAREAAVLIQNCLNSQFGDELQIPLGTISGVPLLSGKGPCVGINVSPQNSVSCSFVSDFTSAGINQTLHRVYLNVDSRVDLIVPTMHHTVEMSMPILVCETILVGTVPETYLQCGMLLGAS